MTQEDEEKLWQRFTVDIEPLKKRRSAKPAKPKPPKKEAAKDPIPTRPVERLVLTPGLKALSTPTSNEPQLDRRTEDRLRKGQMKIAGTLDLHGMTQARAHDALIDFITAAQKSGKRCVLVITGKGNSKKSAGEWLEQKPGILKQRLPQWLSLSPLSRLVLKHYPAQNEHGGSGAFYLYLKRDR